MRSSLLMVMLLLFWGCSTSVMKSQEPPSLQLNQDYLRSLDFQHRTLLLKRIDNQWYYIRSNGKAMLVIEDEDGQADRFHEGLARTRIGGKIGFFDKNLEVVLPPIYDFAFPFHHGISEICIGCKEVKEGAYSILTGGKWKRINRQGLLVEE